MSLKTSQVLISVVLIIIAILSFVSLFQVLRHEESGNIRGGWSDKASSRERVLDQRNRAVSQYTKLIEDELQFAKQKLQQVSSSALSVLHHSSVVSSTEDAGLSSTHSSSSVIATVDDDSTSSPIDPLFQDWKRDVYRKLKCTYQHRILYYMYHARKAAGTTIRDVIKASNQRYFVSYEETEGRILNQKLLGHPQVFTVTTMREPISRILSLYWYEHVGWLHGVLHQTERCKPLREWVNAWQDGASYKTKILKEDPRSNYIEIENYYTKAFSNWDGHSPIGEEDFEKAKQTLLRFDMILISEWLGDETEVDAVNAVFSGRTNLVMGSKLKGNKKMQEKLQALLAADEVMFFYPCHLYTCITDAYKCFVIQLVEYCSREVAKVKSMGYQVV